VAHQEKETPDVFLSSGRACPAAVWLEPALSNLTWATGNRHSETSHRQSGVFSACHRNSPNAPWEPADVCARCRPLRWRFPGPSGQWRARPLPC